MLQRKSTYKNDKGGYHALKGNLCTAGGGEPAG